MRMKEDELQKGMVFKCYKNHNIYHKCVFSLIMREGISDVWFVDILQSNGKEDEWNRRRLPNGKLKEVVTLMTILSNSVLLLSEQNPDELL